MSPDPKETQKGQALATLTPCWISPLPVTGTGDTGDPQARPVLVFSQVFGPTEGWQPANFLLVADTPGATLTAHISVRDFQPTQGGHGLSEHVHIDRDIHLDLLLRPVHERVRLVVVVLLFDPYYASRKAQLWLRQR